MISQDTKKAIVTMGKKAWKSRVKAEHFAIKAATLAVIDNCPLPCDVTGGVSSYIASGAFVNLSMISIHLALLAMQENAILNGQKASAIQAFETLALKLEAADITQEALKLIKRSLKSTSNESLNESLDKAQKIYRYVYAAAYASYLYSAAACHGHFSSKASSVFEVQFTKRLSENLILEPISPSFFLQFFSQKSVQCIAAFLLLAGILALTAAAIPAVSAVILSLTGISATIAATTGGALTVTGASSLSLGFFGTHYLKKQQKAAQENAVNLIESYRSNDCETSDYSTDIGANI
ncbi:hypothetical protein [Legionella yabuuchiae]|uniref:hypothetical protein n=1 Tax=Legionella yabuuchiae TaxID=376727 RepID=UPI0010564EF9|nr:hypothetical protein [Legionella yabuuchiae]